MRGLLSCKAASVFFPSFCTYKCTFKRKFCQGVQVNKSGLLQSPCFAASGLCWRMRLRGDSHPPAGRPRGAPLLWTGLGSRFPRGMVGATLVVARLDRSMLWSFCLPTVIRQQRLACPDQKVIEYLMGNNDPKPPHCLMTGQ